MMMTDRITIVRCPNCEVIMWTTRIRRYQLRHDQAQALLQWIERGNTIETVEDVELSEIRPCECCDMRPGVDELLPEVD